jgi:hypothetical protein
LRNRDVHAVHLRQLELSKGGQTASLNINVPIQTFDFDGVFRTRALVANVQFQSVGQSLSGISSSRFNGGGVRIVQSGHSTSSIAEATGQISLDDLPLSPDNASIETFMNLTVDTTR